MTFCLIMLISAKKNFKLFIMTKKLKENVGEVGQRVRIRKIEISLNNSDVDIDRIETLEELGDFELSSPLEVNKRISYFSDICSKTRNSVVMGDPLKEIIEISPRKFLVHIGHEKFYKITFLKNNGEEKLPSGK